MIHDLGLVSSTISLNNLYCQKSVVIACKTASQTNYPYSQTINLSQVIFLNYPTGIIRMVYPRTVGLHLITHSLAHHLVDQCTWE